MAVTNFWGKNLVPPQMSLTPYAYGMRRWVATTNTEMKRFLGICFAMDLVKKA